MHKLGIFCGLVAWRLEAETLFVPRVKCNGRPQPAQFDIRGAEAPAR